MLSVVRLPKSKAREALDGSFKGIPSSNTLVWAELDPRRKSEVSEPLPPLRAVVMPSWFRNASKAVVCPDLSRSSDPIMVIELPLVR